MLIYLTVLTAAVTIFKPEGIQSQHRCRPTMNGNDADDYNYTRVSCSFENDTDRLCGWRNIDEGYEMTWTTEPFKGNHYAHLDVTYHYQGDKGGLASPWLDPKLCHTCQLQFKYYIKWSNQCRLSLIYQTAQGNKDMLWTTTDSSGSPFSQPICVDIHCSQDRYRMVFEGKKLKRYSKHCGSDWNEIDVDDIVYRWSRDKNCPSTTTHSTTTTLPQTTTAATSSSRHTTSVSPSVKTSINSVASPSTTTKITVLTNDSTSEPLADSNTGGLDTGPLAGIIVAVIVVIVIVVVVVVVLVVHRRGRSDGLQSKGRSKASTSTTSHSRAVTNSAFDSGDRPVLAVLGNAPDRPKGDNADPDHVLTAPDNHYVNVSNDNDSPHRGYELPALPSSSNDAGDSSTNRYTHLRLKGSKGTALSDQVDDDTYDHTEAQQGREHPTTEDEYAVPHKNRKFKPSAPAEGNTFSKTAAAKGSTVYEIAAVESSIAYQNAAGEDYDRVRVLADRKQGGDVGYSLTHNVYASDAAEAAAAYALAETTDYETVDDDGRPVTSPSSVSGDVYNRLNAKGGLAIGQKVRQNHYDHITDPAGTGAEYSSLRLVERTRDLQREMAEGDYSHI